MMKTIFFVSLLALPAFSAPAPTQFQITFYTAADCTEDTKAGANGQATIDIYYGQPMEVPIRFYNLSRDLYGNEQLDFSLSIEYDAGAALQMIMLFSPAACAVYDYSAFSAGRLTGCYTIESPSLYDSCAVPKTNPNPMGADSGRTVEQDASKDAIATGLPPGAISAPTATGLAGSSGNGKGQIG